MIAEDLAWDGPLAPNISFRAGAPGQPLFKYLSPDPVAAASLAQVYRAETHDGKQLAIKARLPPA